MLGYNLSQGGYTTDVTDWIIPDSYGIDFGSDVYTPPSNNGSYSKSDPGMSTSSHSSNAGSVIILGLAAALIAVLALSKR